MSHSVPPALEAADPSSSSAAQMEDSPAAAARSSPKVEEDVVMTEGDEAGRDAEQPGPAAGEQTSTAPVKMEVDKKEEIKLEDLFDGVDSDDDDFLNSSNPADAPEPPSSQGYVSLSTSSRTRREGGAHANRRAGDRSPRPPPRSSCASSTSASSRGDTCSSG